MAVSNIRLIDNKHFLTQLCTRVSLQDSMAENQVIQCFMPYITSMVSKKVNTQLSADIVQEALLQLLIKMRGGQIKDPSALKYYAVSIVNHIVAQSLTMLSKLNEEVIEDVAVIESTAFDDIVEKDKKQLLMNAISLLPTARDQMLLTALLIGFQNKASVCAQWEISPADFDRIIYRAKNRLSDIIN